MPQRATWKKAEKLKSRKRIERVFREGRSFSVFPYKVVYLVSPTGGSAEKGDRASGGPTEGGSEAAQVDAGRAAKASRSTEPVKSPSEPAKFPIAPVKFPVAPATPPIASVKSPIAPVQAGFGAASRNFKKAVDRNRIKRLSREAYRLQKGPLLEQLARKGLSMAVFFVFIGKELPDFPTASARIGVALQKLLKETA
jgi:RNase P protein component